MAYSGRGPTYKVVLLGELGVGKTSLFKRLKDNAFDVGLCDNENLPIMIMQ